MLSYNKTAIVNSSNMKYGGMLFKATENLFIVRAQLFSDNGGITYSFDIFKLDSPDRINNISGITPLASKTYTFDYAGYENVLLKSPISIKKGDNIWVRFDFNKYDDYEFEYPLPFEKPIWDYIPENNNLPYCSYFSKDNEKFEKLPMYYNLAAGLLIGSSQVTGVKVSPDTLSLNVGKEYTLKATVYPLNATDRSVTWKSSDKSVAVVDTKGNVTGVKTGTVVITVTINGTNIKGIKLSSTLKSES